MGSASLDTGKAVVGSWSPVGPLPLATLVLNFSANDLGYAGARLVCWCYCSARLRAETLLGSCALANRLLDRAHCCCAGVSVFQR
jgi:hypothetical protein